MSLAFHANFRSKIRRTCLMQRSESEAHSTPTCRCNRFPGDATTPLAGQGNHALASLFTSTGGTALFMTALRLSSCGVFYAFPPVQGERKAPNTLTRRI